MFCATDIDLVNIPFIHTERENILWNIFSLTKQNITLLWMWLMLWWEGYVFFPSCKTVGFFWITLFPPKITVDVFMLLRI